MALHIKFTKNPVGEIPLEHRATKYNGAATVPPKRQLLEKVEHDGDDVVKANCHLLIVSLGDVSESKVADIHYYYTQTHGIEGVKTRRIKYLENISVLKDYEKYSAEVNMVLDSIEVLASINTCYKSIEFIIDSRAYNASSGKAALLPFITKAFDLSNPDSYIDIGIILDNSVVLP